VKDISIGAGSQGGTYYPVAVGMAEVINKHMEGVTATPEVTGASLENQVLLGNQELEIAIVTAGDLVASRNGEPPFDSKIENVSVMYQGLKPGAVQVVALKDSGIRSIADLRGKKVSLGPQGGGGWKAFAEILPLYDMSLDDLKVSYLAYGDSIEQLTDGTLDAAVIAAGLPTAAIVQLAASAEFVMVPFDQDKLTAFLNDHQYYTKVTIRKEMYAGMTEDVETFATVNLVAIRDDLSEESVYNITKTLFDHLDELKSAHPSLQDLSLEFASEFKGFRYHPGAAKFFREKGFDVPVQ
jgi:TRAP transporter TAXI family solute receptor